MKQNDCSENKFQKKKNIKKKKKNCNQNAAACCGHGDDREAACWFCTQSKN